MKQTTIILALITSLTWFSQCFAQDLKQQNRIDVIEADTARVTLNTFEILKQDFVPNLNDIKGKIEGLEKYAQYQESTMHVGIVGGSLGLSSAAGILYFVNGPADSLAGGLVATIPLSLGLGSISAGVAAHDQKNKIETQIKELKKKVDHAFLNRLKLKYPKETNPGKAETIYAKYKADTLTNLEIAEAMSHDDYSYACALRITSNLAQSQDFYGRFHEKVKKKYGSGVAENATQMLTKMEITEEDLVEHFGDKFPEFKTILEELHSNEKNIKNIPVVVETEKTSKH